MPKEVPPLFVGFAETSLGVPSVRDFDRRPDDIARYRSACEAPSPRSTQETAKAIPIVLHTRCAYTLSTCRLPKQSSTATSTDLLGNVVGRVRVEQRAVTKIQQRCQQECQSQNGVSVYLPGGVDTERGVRCG